MRKLNKAHLESDVWFFVPDRVAADSELKRNQPEADSEAQLQSTNSGVLRIHIYIACHKHFIYLFIFYYNFLHHFNIESDVLKNIR